MNLPFKMALPESLTGSSGTYALYSRSESDDKVYLQLGVSACPGRKDGKTYHAVGLMCRILYTGSDPVLTAGFENRGTRQYQKTPGNSDVMATQMNKMLFPVATINIGSEKLLESIGFHLEALSELLNPLIEANKQLVQSTLMDIFEAQNPALFLPVVNFPAPKVIKSWEESLADLKAAQAAGYVPKGNPLDDPTKGAPGPSDHVDPV